MIHNQLKVRWFHVQLNLLKNVWKEITSMHVKQFLSYDDVLREQREIIYKQRFEVIDAEENIRDIIESMMESSIQRAVAVHTSE